MECEKGGTLADGDDSDAPGISNVVQVGLDVNADSIGALVISRSQKGERVKV